LEARREEYLTIELRRHKGELQAKRLAFVKAVLVVESVEDAEPQRKNLRA
jgi:hypothetical protein